MRVVYIDSEFKVHTTNADGRAAIETDAFDSMSDCVIECHVFVPYGQSYTKSNGDTVCGEFIQPFVSEKELDAVQREHEKQLLAEYETELAELRENSISLPDLDAAYQEGVNAAYDQ